MASSIVSSAAVASVNRASPAQGAMVAPFNGLKSAAAFPVTRKNNDITTLASNGGRVQCMKVWPTFGLKKFETLSYLPDLDANGIMKEVNYLLNKGWICCIEWEIDHPYPYRFNNRSPGYYDGHFWTMWKLPMYGCTDASQVMVEIEECKKEYPQAHIRIIGFDNRRQVQCISFIVYKPPSASASA